MGDVALGDAYTLLRVLEAVAQACARTGAWRFKVVMCTATLDAPMLIGAGNHVWRASITGKLQNGLQPRDLLAAYRGVAATIDPDGPVWLFDELGSRPPGGQLDTVVRRGAKRTQVTAAVLAAIEEQQRIRRELEARREAEPEAPPWTTCPVCNGIAASSYASWKGGVLDGGGVPVADGYLEILGAPDFGDSVGSRDWCIKRCSLCATHYHWQGDYEYLAGGSEDSISITRVEPADLPDWLDKVAARLRARRGS